MAASRLYSRLEAEIKRIEACYLPRAVRPHGYSKREVEQIRAYYVFCHSAIEQFLEDACVRVADRALETFVNKGNIRKAMLALAISAIPMDRDSAVIFKKSVKSDKIDDIAKMLVKRYKDSIDGNHGVRPAHVKSLVGPIGVAEDDLDPAWLAGMDGFGAKRGAAAHSYGRSFVALYSPDAVTARMEVQALLVTPGGGGLKALDKLLGSM